MQMNYLVITCHPYGKSFSAGIAETIKKSAEQNGEKTEIIDLIEDGFNPVMTGEDLRGWRVGQQIDPLVKKYQQAVENADVVVFPFPIWWGFVPAVLKGFCDKVFLPGWAYKYDENGEMVGLLTSKKAIVIMTMETPVEIYEKDLNDPIEGAFIKNTLQKCGFDVTDYVKIDKIVSGGREYAQEKMKEIEKLFS
jgi:putative NADPH-quinone reductase